MLFNYVSVIPNCISLELIQFFLSHNKAQTSPATITGQNGIGEIDVNYRKTNWIPLSDETIENTTNLINTIYDTKLISVFKQTIKHIERPQYLYYTEGGKYNIHNDSEDIVNNKLKRVCDRDVSILIYLNDNYEGGELEFPEWGVTFKPKAGTLIAFPSYVEFSHRVHPVTKGERFNLVSWICTNDRIYPRPYDQTNLRKTWVLSS